MRYTLMNFERALDGIEAEETNSCLGVPMFLRIGDMGRMSQATHPGAARCSPEQEFLVAKLFDLVAELGGLFELELLG
jgi:hypothetical protein